MNKKKIYSVNKIHFKNITQFQKDEFIATFPEGENENIDIPYEHKGYLCNTKSPVFSKPDIQAISFFSGCGGLDIGTQLAGVKVLSSLDFYEDSVKSMSLNNYFSHTKHFCKDINDVSGEDFQELIHQNNPKKLIIVGGPPCQPFSKAGYWVTNEKRSSNDDPRNMIDSYFRIISEIKPDGFILENVESILHPSNREAVETIESHMNNLGYKFTLLKINAADYGIPQKRKRVFYLASKKEIYAELPPTHAEGKKLLLNPSLKPYERVVDWIAEFDKPEYYKDEQISTEGKYEFELSCVPPGKNYIALSEKAGHPNPSFVANKRYWSSLLKLHPLLSSWTIIASPGHWEGPFHWTNRRLSIRECAAIQTFPDDYKFYGTTRSQRKQIGNAVPPLLGKLIIEELCKWI